MCPMCACVCVGGTGYNCAARRARPRARPPSSAATSTRPSRCSPPTRSPSPSSTERPAERRAPSPSAAHAQCRAGRTGAARLPVCSTPPRKRFAAGASPPPPLCVLVWSMKLCGRLLAPRRPRRRRLQLGCLLSAALPARAVPCACAARGRTTYSHRRATPPPPPAVCSEAPRGLADCWAPRAVLECCDQRCKYKPCVNTKPD